MTEAAENKPKQPDGQSLVEAWAQLDAAISQAQRIVLSTHENPDGDGLGSQLAMYEHLQSLGKECRILNCTNAPAVLHFLDPEGWLETYDPLKHDDWLAKCDLAIMFDVGDFRRLRCVGQAVARHGISMASIDHHPQTGYDSSGGSNPFKYLVVDYSAPSTGTLVWQYFNDYRTRPLTLQMANALYAALVTDTGSFKYDNTDARAHHMAVDLLEAGVRPYDIHKLIYEQRTR
ncbi:MAG: DHH family phosphoesterase, partial [Candidatus Marinimicrobia bacterium]|nr:DHH family phosphoesterase [Candidatus Neomarinimicrobiota bacterium]